MLISIRFCESQQSVISQCLDGSAIGAPLRTGLGYGMPMKQCLTRVLISIQLCESQQSVIVQSLDRSAIGAHFMTGLGYGISSSVDECVDFHESQQSVILQSLDGSAIGAAHRQTTT